MCNQRQSMMAGGNGYENIHIANNNSFAGECMANLSIVTSPVIDDWKNLKVLSYHLWFSQVFFYVLTMQSTVRSLCYRNLGSENLVLWNLRNMRSNTTTMMEILNPSVRIKDIAFQPTKAEGECFLSLKYIANFSFFPPERRLDSKVFCTFALEHRYRGKPPLKSERRRRCDFCG